MQIQRFKKPVFKALANYEERAGLSNGDTVHRPYRSTMRVRDYTKGTAVTIGDISSTDESLAVNTTKVVAFYVDDLDDLQNKYATVNTFAYDAGIELWNFIDGQFLGQYTTAVSTITDTDIGGAATGAAIVSVATIPKLFSAAAKKLDRQNIGREKRFAVISPTIHQLLVERMDGKDSALGDSTGMNGHIGKYMGFELYLSNALTFTATWTPANNPSDADTVTINGVVFTFKTTPVLAGAVDIGGTTADTLANLVLAINGTGTPGSTTYIVLSDANQKTLEGTVAAENDTTLTIVYNGGSESVVAASETADPWSLQVTHQLFGEKGATDLVIQKEPNVNFKEVPDKLGKNVLPWTLYGIKTFREGTLALVDVQVATTSLV